MSNVYPFKPRNGRPHLRLVGGSDTPERLKQREPLQLNTVLPELAEQGFKSVARGWGIWVVGGSLRLAKISFELCVIHPDERRVALSTYAFDEEGNISASDLLRTDFANPSEYQNHVEEWGLSMTPSLPIDEIIAQYNATPSTTVPTPQ